MDQNLTNEVIVNFAKRCVASGKTQEQERIIKMLQDYFDLTQEPDDHGNITDNSEWDHGFQAAIALIKNNRS